MAGATANVTLQLCDGRYYLPVPTLAQSFWSAPSSWSAAGLQAARAPNVAAFTGGPGQSGSSYFYLTAYWMVELVACPGSALSACTAINATNPKFSWSNANFAEGAGFYNNPGTAYISYLTAGGCTGDSSAPGYASVDLTGTPFTLDETLVFRGYATTYAVSGNATTSGGPNFADTHFQLPPKVSAVSIAVQGYCAFGTTTALGASELGPGTYGAVGVARLGQQLLLGPCCPAAAWGAAPPAGMPCRPCSPSLQCPLPPMLAAPTCGPLPGRSRQQP